MRAISRCPNGLIELAPASGVDRSGGRLGTTDIVKRSHNARPAADAAIDEAQVVKGAEQLELLTGIHASGLQPDVVGELVLKAMRANGLYIHTDHIMANVIAARIKALLDAMPAA